MYIWKHILNTVIKTVKNIAKNPLNIFLWGTDSDNNPKLQIWVNLLLKKGILKSFHLTVQGQFIYKKIIAEVASTFWCLLNGHVSSES